MPTNSAINTTNPIGIVSGGTDTASFANQYGVIYYNGTQLSSTTAGVSGTVLRSNGSSMAPSFQASPAAGGSWVLIQTQAVSSVTQVVFTISPSAYNNYAFLISAAQMQNGNPTLQYETSANGGSTWSGGAYVANDLEGAGAQVNTTTGPGNSLFAGLNVLSQYPAGILWLYNVNGPSYTVSKCLAIDNTGTFKTAVAIGAGISGINALRFISNGVGSIPALTVSQYGILS